MFVDSHVSQIWLPLIVRQASEKAFNLTWNEDAGLYLLEDTVRASLLSQNPVFTFTVGSADDSIGGTVEINIPFAAFDLKVTLPVVNETAYYFPLKRAQNNTQYILGRVFLQEAYIIADHEREKCVSVSQALFPSTSVAQHLVTIEPLRNGSSTAHHSRLSTGAIVAIVIGGVLGLSGAVLAYWKSHKARQSRKMSQGRESDNGIVVVSEHTQGNVQSCTTTDTKPQLDDVLTARYEFDQDRVVVPQLHSGHGFGHRHELEQTNRAQEMQGSMAHVELP